MVFILFFVIVRVGGFGVARVRRENFGAMGGENISGKREERNLVPVEIPGDGYYKKNLSDNFQ